MTDLTIYAFFNAAGHPLRALSEMLVRKRPGLAQILSPVPLSELSRYALPLDSDFRAEYIRRADKGEVAWLFYPMRRDKVETVFSFEGDVCRVEKRVLERAHRWFPSKFRQLALDPEPLAHGVPVEAEIVDLVGKSEFEKAFGKLEKFFRLLSAQYPLDENGLFLPSMVDALPRNAVLNASGRLQLFDLEYEREGGVNLSFLIYRAIRMDLIFVLPKAQRDKIDFRKEYDALCKRLGVMPQFDVDARESKALKHFTNFSPSRFLMGIFLFFIPFRSLRRFLAWWDATPVLQR